MTTTYKYVGSHINDLDDGRILEPYQLYEDIDATSQHNQRLIDEGLLILVPPINLDATPDAVEFAAENGVDLSEVTGSGKDGRITKADVEAHHKKEES